MRAPYHECGGTALVGLHDAGNANENGTYVRTYALGPRQNGNDASSGGGANATTVATPANIQRGDIDFGSTSPSGWFPNYSTYQFQGRPELWPRVDTNGRRIVVAYASNPLTNGNGSIAGGTPGNHTPMDIWVGADDNIYGLFARRITGHGLLDNTYLTHIMADFLKVGTDKKSSEPDVAKIGHDTIEKATNEFGLQVYPNPAASLITVSFNSPVSGEYSMQVYALHGGLVKSFSGTITENNQRSVTVDAAGLANGMYTAKLLISVNGEMQTSVAKFMIQH